jgi:hypothetical protein
VKDEVLLTGPSEVELKPRAVVASLTPNKKVELEEERVDVEVLDTDEMVEIDDELVLGVTVVVVVVVVGVATVLALVALSEVEIELLAVVSTALIVEEELVVLGIKALVLD